MTVHSLHVSTPTERAFCEVTAALQDLIRQVDIHNGLCFLFLPHTTAALVVNENWDPDVQQDILLSLNRNSAPPLPDHKHSEGNSAAHVQSILAGSNLTLFIEDGSLVLGSWQGVFLAEFDGPRRRKILVKFLPDA